MTNGKNTQTKESKTENTKASIAALYEQYASEAQSKAQSTAGKKYSATSIRVAIRELFTVTGADELVMSSVVQALKAGDAEVFGELKYQEVRATVKGKKFSEVKLDVNDKGQSVIRRV